MKILVTGANGLLGQKLTQLLQTKKEVKLVATARNESVLPVTGFSFRTMNICERDQVMKVVSEERPDVLINAAAMTAVDKCETERDACWKANVDAVGHIVDACEKYNVRLVHVSTDFIFDGSSGPLTEEAEPAPVNYYGESKLAAEKIIMASGANWAILRTVLVYGIASDPGRSNIVLWVKESLEQGKKIQVVNDQWRTPTLAEDLAMGCYLAAVREAKGIYNISGKDFMSPYDIAVQTAIFFELDKSLITPTDSTRFRQPARRPLTTGLVIDKARRDLGYEPRSFTEGLQVISKNLAKAVVD